MHNVQKYYVQGFSLVIAPGHTVRVDAFFRWMGHSPNITGIDCYDQNERYVGFIYPQNLHSETAKALRKYIEGHRSKWVRVYTGTEGKTRS